jgi:hypothetical protein
MRFKYVLYLLFSLIIACTVQQVNSQSMLGNYFSAKKNNQMLKLCVDNEWYYTNCYLELFYIINQQDSIPNCSNFVEKTGKYSDVDSLLFLYDYNDSLFVKIEIVDTFNIKVHFIQDEFDSFVFFNRHSAFFNCHKCMDHLSVDCYKWYIFEEVDDYKSKYFEIFRFREPGYMFKPNNYEVEKLSDEIFK